MSEAIPLTSAEATAEVTRIADALLDAHRRRAGVVASRGGWDYETDEDRAERHAVEDDWLRALTRLDNALPVGSTEWATHGMLRHEIASSVARRVCRSELWDLNQMTGWQMAVSHTAAMVPVDTPDDHARALRMFEALPAMVRDREGDLRRGVAAGYTAARHAVLRVLEQLSAMLTGDVLDSPARRSGDQAFAARWQTLVDERVRPALEQFRDYLTSSYLPAAREAPGLDALPDGDACYRAEVARYTSLHLTPDEILEGVEDEIAELDAQLAPIIRRLYGSVSLAEGKRAVRADPRWAHSGRDEMIAHARAVMERVRPRLPEFFLHIPDAPLLIEAMTPVEEQTGASGYYQSPDGAGRPGRYVINTMYAPVSPTFETTGSALHEGIPGHHFERVYGDTRTARHPATRELMTQATREGWAYYCLWLGEAMGFYDSDAARAGYRLQFLDTWAGLWCDVHLHTRGASREELIDALVRFAGRRREAAAARVDRYMAAPGQMPCYMVGFRETRRLRREAEAGLGDRFDARVFHDVLLRDGPVTLPMQRAKVARWISH